MRPIVHCHLVNGPFGDPVLYAEIMFERRALLFDLGDIAALPPRKLLRVSHVFVSHAHLDHFVGFDRLLRVLLGRDKTVALYGPAGFIDQVGHKLYAYTWNVVRNYAGNLVFDVHEVHGDASLGRARFQSRHALRREPMPDLWLEGNLLTSCGGLVVRCVVLDHGTPCLGFALQEPAHVNIWKTRLDELGLEVGPWLRDLKRALQAGALARRAQAKRLIPCHFSTRYTGHGDALFAEAQRAFGGATDTGASPAGCSAAPISTRPDGAAGMHRQSATAALPCPRRTHSARARPACRS